MKFTTCYSGSWNLKLNPKQCLHFWNDIQLQEFHVFCASRSTGSKVLTLFSTCIFSLLFRSHFYGILVCSFRFSFIVPVRILRICKSDSRTSHSQLEKCNETRRTWSGGLKNLTKISGLSGFWSFCKETFNLWNII